MNVVPGLKRKLEKELGDTAKQQSNTEGTRSTTFAGIDAVIQRLIKFMDSNLFVPCWKELRQVVELINSGKNDTVRLNETKGLIRFTLNSKNGKYHYKGSITVDPLYPNTTELLNYGKPCNLKMESTNLPSSIETLITQQAQELVRRLQDGMQVQHARSMSNPVHLPITNIESSSSKGRNKNGRDDSELTAEQIWQRNEVARLKMYGIPHGSYDGSNPQQSLLSLVTFLRETIQTLPTEKCPICEDRILPTEPSELSSLFKVKVDAKTKRRRPIRTHCGHWYHLGCLDKAMNEPPFGIEQTCTGIGDIACERPLYHPNWSFEDAHERERIYNQRQAREREIADAADFF